MKTNLQITVQEFKQPRYGLINSGIFGFTVVSGIITGIKFTEEEPIFEISFGKNKWETSQIADTPEKLIDLLKIPDLKRVAETHGLKIKFGFLD